MSLVQGNFFKKYILIIGGTIAILPFGFYFLYRYIKKRQSKVDQLEDTISLDTSKASININDKKTQNNQTYKEQDANTEISPEILNEIKPNVEEKKIQNILIKISENVLNTIIMTYDVLREDYDRATQKFKADKVTLQDLNANKFKAGIIYNLINDNKNTLKDFKVTEDDYKFALNYYMAIKKNKTIIEHYNFINKILLEFQKEDSFSIDLEFPKEIKENYMKIVTNTFYYTLKKVTSLIREEYAKGKNSQDELASLVGKYYQQTLGEVRKRVLDFFHVKDAIVKNITLVRCYVFTLPRNDEVRKQHEMYLHILNQVEDNLAQKIIPEEFVDNTNSNYSDEIKDDIIDLNRLIKNTIDLNSISN